MQVETVAAKPLALEIHWNGDLVDRLELKWADSAPPTPNPGPTAGKLLEALQRYVAGQRPEWPDLPLDLDALPPFRRRALCTLFEKVGFGDVVTYAQLAEMAGSPKGFRAAGQAMRHNPWPLVYPCHRVNGSSGSLTGFGGADGDLSLKQWLQTHERKHR